MQMHVELLKVAPCKEPTAGEEVSTHVARQDRAPESGSSVPTLTAAADPWSMNIATPLSHTSADSPLPSLLSVFVVFGITFNEKSTCLTP